MDDSVLYTGVDGEGVFGNESVNAEVQDKIQEQERLLNELTPQLEDIIAMIDGEKAKHLETIATYVAQTKDTDEVFRSEMKASALYRVYLDDLKNVFILKLNEVKK